MMVLRSSVSLIGVVVFVMIFKADSDSIDRTVWLFKKAISANLERGKAAFLVLERFDDCLQSDLLLRSYNPRAI